MKDIQKHFDDEIRKTIIGATATSDFQQKSGEDVLSNLNDMICKMTTLIMCSQKNKELLDKSMLEWMEIMKGEGNGI